MNYLAALHRVERRRDDYTLVPLTELIEIGHFDGVDLADISLPYTWANKREIMIEAEVNERLVAAVPKPDFERCGDKVFITGSSYAVGAVVNAFDPSIFGVVRSEPFSRVRDWCLENDIEIVRVVGVWIFFSNEIDRTLFRVRFPEPRKPNEN